MPKNLLEILEISSEGDNMIRGDTVPTTKGRTTVPRTSKTNINFKKTDKTH